MRMRKFQAEWHLVAAPFSLTYSQTREGFATSAQLMAAIKQRRQEIESVGPRLDGRVVIEHVQLYEVIAGPDAKAPSGTAS
jgi:hypothetical protein